MALLSKLEHTIMKLSMMWPLKTINIEEKWNHICCTSILRNKIVIFSWVGIIFLSKRTTFPINHTWVFSIICSNTMKFDYFQNQTWTLTLILNIHIITFYFFDFIYTVTLLRLANNITGNCNYCSITLVIVYFHSYYG